MPWNLIEKILKAGWGGRDYSKDSTERVTSFEKNNRYQTLTAVHFGYTFFEIRIKITYLLLKWITNRSTDLLPYVYWPK